MRTYLVAAFTLGLLATAYVPAASADALCLPGVPEQRATCVAAGPCHTFHTEGLCAGAVSPAGGLRATCQHHAMDAGFCAGNAGAAGHGAAANVGCARDHGVGCHSGVGADGSGVAGAGLRAGRAGVCAGVGVRAAGQGVAQCVPLAHV